MPDVPHLVGIDLAWGEKRPTGVAVLDPEGRLVHVSSVQTDDEVVDAVSPYVEGPCLVALDAPLIVTNATGNRPAEAQLNRDFRSFHAGAHPSNTGKPEFADGTRGARLCSRLALDMNPRSGRARRAIEVYPHPATVSMFQLPRTLKYKNKPGRDLELLREQLLLLMSHLDRLRGAVPALHLGEQWDALREAAAGAARKVDLRHVEDQVDAVLCAYVALLAERRPDDVTTYGDLATGYIVTPRLDLDLGLGRYEPGASGHDAAPAAVAAYAAGHPDLVLAGAEALTLVTDLLDEAGINYLTVSGRTKSIASFAEKATRAVDGVRLYRDPLREIGDQIGVRVITYVRDDVDAVADLLADQVVVRDDRDLGRETASEGRFGYASRHLQITLDAPREKLPAYAHLPGRNVQVQIRTVLQHAWAEFEHDIRYKGTVPPEHAHDFDRRFTLAAGLLELADQEFTTIRNRLRGPLSHAEQVAATDDPRLEPRELAAFLAGQYADAGWSRSDHYAWVSGLLLELGVTSLDELGEVLRAVDEDAIRDRMDYRYPPGAVRRLDDALLATYGERYVGLPGNSHRVAALRARLDRLRDGRP
jgi:predicted RNase H-like nuclease/ppGpp synthetase/RelA/SpoT-type nucleotidyltranferase